MGTESTDKLLLWWKLDLILGGKPFRRLALVGPPAPPYEVRRGGNLYFLSRAFVFGANDGTVTSALAVQH